MVNGDAESMEIFLLVNDRSINSKEAIGKLNAQPVGGFVKMY